MENSSLREAKSLTEGHITRWCWSWDSNLDPSDRRAQVLQIPQAAVDSPSSIWESEVQNKTGRLDGGPPFNPKIKPASHRLQTAVLARRPHFHHIQWLPKIWDGRSTSGLVKRWKFSWIQHHIKPSRAERNHPFDSSVLQSLKGQRLSIWLSCLASRCLCALAGCDVQAFESPSPTNTAVVVCKQPN